MFKSKIKTFYEKHDCERICQGDILRDFHIFFTKANKEAFEGEFLYIIILSQDCDILNEYLKRTKINNNEQQSFNQFLPNIIYCPAFPYEEIKEGTHLEKLYNIKQENLITSKVKNNREDRFHYLQKHIDYQVPELVIDFKLYYTMPVEDLCKQHKISYLATVNELFRENLSQRFSNYLNRIGLPEIKENT